MELIRIEVDGILNIDSVILDLKKFNSLISLNNYGKTNVITAIGFGIDFINSDEKNKLELMKSPVMIPINKVLQNRDFIFCFEFKTNFSNKSYYVNYGFTFEWIKSRKKNSARIKNEHLKIRPEKGNKKYRTLLKRNLKKTYYLSSKTGRCDKHLIVNHSELGVNKLKFYDNLFYKKIIKDVHKISGISISSNINPEQSFNTVFQNINEKKESNGINDSYFLYMLKQDDPKTYRLLLDAIHSLLPNIKYFEPIEIDIKKQIKIKDKDKIPFTLPEKMYDIRVKEATNNQQTSIQSISTGSKKIISVLLAIIMSELSHTNLLVLEELENSIHPSLLQRLLMIIDNLSNNLKILITSHSPYLIRYLDLNNVYLGIPNTKGVAKFGKIKESKINGLVKIAKDEGVYLGDYIFDKLLENPKNDLQKLLG